MKTILLITAFLGGILLSISQYLIFLYAPEEASLGIVQKIFYMHVPFAWWGFVAYFLVFCSSIFYLKTKNQKWDLLSGAAAEVGILFTAFTLVTGMIWGRNSWGVWWTWDPRLTTALIMFFIYIGYLLVRQMDFPEMQRKKISAVLGIIAFADVPLVFFAARLWRSIHPAVFTSEGIGLTQKMLITFLFTFASMFFIWFTLTFLRYRQMSLNKRVDFVIMKQIEKE
ncbi:MAG: cytochrome c biogenesis protein [Desulfovibrionaceae bacterium]